MAGVLSQCRYLSLLSMSVDPREVLWAKAALALVPLCGDLKPEFLLRPFLLMRVINKLNLSCTSLSFPWKPGQTRTVLIFHSESFGIQTKIWMRSLRA